MKAPARLLFTTTLLALSVNANATNGYFTHGLGVINKGMAGVGISHGQQPIEETEVLFNMLAPAVIERHFTFGATRRMANASEWSAMLMYAPEGEITGRNSFDPTQRIELKMHQFELEIGYSW